MKRKITLILFINILFINSLFAYNNENKCEDYLSKDKPAEAIIAAKSLASKYDSNFCAAKAKYYQNDYEGAIESFEKVLNMQNYRQIRCIQFYIRVSLSEIIVK